MPEQNNHGALVFKGTDAVEHTDVVLGLGRPQAAVRHVRQVYVEKCVGCGNRVTWRRWVPSKRGFRGPGRTLSRRRFLRCHRCTADHHAEEVRAARKKTALDRWMHRHGSGVSPSRTARFH